VPIVLGGIEGSLRRIAHYDYWQDKVRRRSWWTTASATCCSTATPSARIVEIAHRLAAREPVEQITDVRGTAFVRRATHAEGWFEIDSTSVDVPGRVEAMSIPTSPLASRRKAQGQTCAKEDEGAEAAAAEAPPRSTPRSSP
jgi:radical SAM superfamily enzyme YgiQ (UPF0313 family)